MTNYYHILGISQSASQREIKEAYRKLALRYHPDKNPDNAYAEERFKEISHAYHILRDPQRKAQHDHSLAYAAFKQETAKATYTTYTSPPPYAYESPQQRARRRSRGNWQASGPRPAVTSKKNLVATAWAFGIIIALALVVFGLTSYQSYHQEQVRARQDELAAGIYKEAEELFMQRNYEQSLKLLKTIDEQHNISYDAGHLRQNIFNTIEEEANQNYEQRNYRQAAAGFQLLADNKPEYDALTFAKLVSSYEMIPDYPHAISAYTEVIKAEPYTIEARLGIARLFYNLGEHKKALEYYREASDIVIMEYQNLYGKAYALAVDPRRTPESHYQLHCRLGLTYSELGMFREAQSALKWAIFLRPEAPEAHFLMGNTFRKEGRSGEACKKWKEAKKHGSREAASQLKKYCK